MQILVEYGRVSRGGSGPYGVVTGDPPSLIGGGNGSGDGGGSLTSCPLQ